MKKICFDKFRGKKMNLHNPVKRPIHVIIYLHAVLSFVKTAFKIIFRCTCRYN